MIFDEIEKILQSKIIGKKPVSGGDINDAYKLTTSDGQNLFLKYNNSSFALDMFISEADGLNILNSIDRPIVPIVIDHFNVKTGACLILEWIERSQWTNEAYSQLGRDLAEIHKISNKDFGYFSDNYLATIIQKNDFQKSFPDFYLKCRIEPLLKKLMDQNILTPQYSAWCDIVYDHLFSIIPEEIPALLHGDLWSGNIMNSAKGAYFIDPAVYFGHREIDLAMTKLFGGFPDQFYHSYQDVFPLKEGWEDRIDLFQLYPILIHLLLFGRSYLGNATRILNKYK